MTDTYCGVPVEFSDDPRNVDGPRNTDGRDSSLIENVKETAIVTKDDDGVLIINDTIKGTTIGDPDGPLRFVESLGCKVPTYINPRDDLITDEKTEKRFLRLDYHVPYKLRGYFKFYDWPVAYREKIIEEFGGLVVEGVDGGFDRINDAGYVLCSGVTRASVPARGFMPGMNCKRRAVNRTMFCSSHGGALHLADKKISNKTLMPIPTDRIEKLDRVQKFMQGFLSVEELDDDEIQGNYIRNDKGIPIKARHLDRKFEMEIAKELHVRLNRYLREKTGTMLEVMVDIAQNDLYEAADRIKAAQWVAERTMGKTPDVLIHGRTDAPYESILESLESGSRESYRQSIASTRVGIGPGGSGNLGQGGNGIPPGRAAFEKIVDAEFEELMDGEDEESPEDFEGDLGEDLGDPREDLGDSLGGDLGENGDGNVFYGGEQSVSELSTLQRENERENGRELLDNDFDIEATGEGAENSAREGEEGRTETDADSGAAAYAREIEERKARAKEQRDRIQKAKKRRFAARANGAKQLSGGLSGGAGLDYGDPKNGAWLVEFVGINQRGKYQVRFWPPDRQSPAIIRRAVASHAVDEAQVVASQAEQAQALDAEAARLEAQLAAIRLKGK